MFSILASWKIRRWLHSARAGVCMLKIHWWLRTQVSEEQGGVGGSGDRGEGWMGNWDDYILILINPIKVWEWHWSDNHTGLEQSPPTPSDPQRIRCMLQGASNEISRICAEIGIWLQRYNFRSLVREFTFSYRLAKLCCVAKSFLLVFRKSSRTDRRRSIFYLLFSFLFSQICSNIVHSRIMELWKAKYGALFA